MERYNYRYSSTGSASIGSTSMISQQATKSVANAYVKVMNEVCSTVRETFLDEGVEISILDELRRLWEYKLHQSKVLESTRPFPAGDVSRNATAVYGNVYGASQGHQTLHIPAGARVESFGDSSGVNAPGSQIFQLAASSNQIIAPQARLPANARIISGVNMPANLPPGSTVRVLRAPIQQHNLVAAQASSANVATIVSTSGGNNPAYVSDNSNTLPASDFVQIDGARPVLADIECQTTQHSQQPAPHVATALPGVAKMFLQLDGQGAMDDSDDDDSDDDFQEDIPQSRPPAKSQKMSSPSKSRVVPKTEPTDPSSQNADDDDDDDDSSDDSDDLDGKLKNEGQDDAGEEEEPLNSGDDVTDDEANTFTAGEDVVVCQYEKVRRQKNRWNLVLKDGIMNVQGRDVLFHRAEVLCDW